MEDALLVRARRVWTELAGVSVEFPGAGVSVVVSAGSLLCPPEWAGIVVLGDAGIVTVPDERQRQLVHAALADAPVESMTDADWLRTVVPVAEVLGPASLAYVDEDRFRPAAGEAVVEALPGSHPELAALLAMAAEEEAAESSLDEITSPAFVVRSTGVGVAEEGTVVAAGGYRLWLDSVAHVSVLTSAGHRGRGLGRIAGSAAVSDALVRGLLPQWRARVMPSRRIARSLGFEELGTQLSFRVAP
jgi:hypothetical protein